MLKRDQLKSVYCMVKMKDHQRKKCREQLDMDIHNSKNLLAIHLNTCKSKFSIENY